MKHRTECQAHAAWTSLPTRYRVSRSDRSNTIPRLVESKRDSFTHVWLLRRTTGWVEKVVVALATDKDLRTTLAAGVYEDGGPKHLPARYQ